MRRTCPVMHLKGRGWAHTSSSTPAAAAASPTAVLIWACRLWLPLLLLALTVSFQAITSAIAVSRPSFTARSLSVEGRSGEEARVSRPGTCRCTWGKQSSNPNCAAEAPGALPASATTAHPRSATLHWPGSRATKQSSPAPTCNGSNRVVLCSLVEVGQRHQHRLHATGLSRGHLHPATGEQQRRQSQ